MLDNNNLRICTRCVMDESAAGINFDNNGICSYCIDLEEKLKNNNSTKNIINDDNYKNLITKIKKDGENKKYDCIIGLSGGVDSSWVLYLAVKSGLRPLAVHMDNGWNSELSQENIQNLVTKLNVDLYTHVIDWNEYKKLQQSFFDANVIDIELLYDNALAKVNFSLASKYNLKYILSGSNSATEGMRMPLNWAYKNKYDKTNILSIWNKFGDKTKIKTFPFFGIFDFIFYIGFKGIKWLSFLDNTNYNKQDAINTLINDVGYRPYPYKHYESIFTRFYQGYILPNKFKVDKRKIHLSTLICTNQLSRTDAVKQMESDPYPSEQELELDLQYFLKKMGWTKQMLFEYINTAEQPHEKYGSEDFYWNLMFKIKKILKK